ncbi:hypothetical protein C4K30_4903 [Pseudomonas chlororaphis subsp. piscium]|nr:hypothetical protein C4K30_4903 [Pseudomonas chlororaphis subsp. piscium]
MGWGIALHIQRQTQQPDMFSETLRRHFEKADAYEGCCIYLDSQLTFVIWHKLHTDHQCKQIYELVHKLLSLAGLKH